MGHDFRQVRPDTQRLIAPKPELSNDSRKILADQGPRTSSANSHTNPHGGQIGGLPRQFVLAESQALSHGVREEKGSAQVRELRTPSPPV